MAEDQEDTLDSSPSSVATQHGSKLCTTALLIGAYHTLPEDPDFQDFERLENTRQVLARIQQRGHDLR